MEDITNIKKKFYGLRNENESKRLQLKREVTEFYTNCLHVFPGKYFYYYNCDDFY